MSTVSTVSSNSAADALAAQTAASLPQQSLNQQDFLTLLVAQLSAQDPMNPVSNTDFAAQMAQFTALQTAQTTQANTAAIQSSQAALQANSLLGLSVQVQPAQGSPITGVVSAVTLQAGTPSITVNGQSYDLSQVLSVSAAQTQSN